MVSRLSKNTPIKKPKRRCEIDMSYNIPDMSYKNHYKMYMMSKKIYNDPIYNDNGKIC